MKSIISLIILLTMIIAGVYLTIVGALGLLFDTNGVLDIFVLSLGLLTLYTLTKGYFKK